MTRAARASRKRRSMPSSLRKAPPPQSFIAPVGHRRRRPRPASALTSSTRSIASSRPVSSAVSVSARKARARRCAMHQPGEVAPGDGLRRPASAPRCSSVVAGQVAAASRPDRALIETEAERGAEHQEPAAAPAPSAMSSPAPSAPSMAVEPEPGRPSAVTGREPLPAQPQPVEVAGHAQPGACRPAPATASSGRRRGQRPARPDVAVGLAGRGHPALAGVQADAVVVGGCRGADRRPEVAARAGLGERQRGQVVAGGDGLADVPRAVRLDDGGRPRSA